MFINGISKKSMGRALLPLFFPAEDTPALGRAQSPAYIRLRQVAALSHKDLLFIMVFPDYTFWEEGYKTRRRITRGKRVLQSITPYSVSWMPPAQELLAQKSSQAAQRK